MTALRNVTVRDGATRRGPRGGARRLALLLVGSLVAGAGLVPVAAPRPLGAQVSVDELEVHMQLAPDRAPITRVIPVRNEEDVAQQVRISLGDWTRDSLGYNLFTEPGSQPSSCGDRVQVFPQTFQVAAGATEMVRVAYTPTPADSGCWSIVFIETVKPPPAQPDAQGSFLTIEIRTGVKLYVHRPGEIALGAVQDAWMDEVWRRVNSASGVPDSVRVREATVLFANTGTAHLRVRSTMEIRSLDNRVLHTIDGGEAPMTPGSTRQIRIPLPALAAGDYVAIVLLDYGGDEVTAAQLDIRIP
ncbi:MAG TPA: hypothetical protein VFM71_04300 [Gemmatimonadaceae bacterium]|nr:hypothetical protein [Gemmatimonadaceae bacterium]